MNPLCFSCGGLKASGGRDSPEARDLVKSCASPIHLLVNLRQASWRGRIRNAQKLIRSRMSYLREPNMFVRERYSYSFQCTLVKRSDKLERFSDFCRLEAIAITRRLEAIS